LKKADVISIGKVLRSQGKRGELRVKLFLSCPEKPFFSKVFFKGKNALKEFKVESCYSRGKYYILKLKGVQTIAEAQDLVGQEILIPEEEIQPLEKDEFYTYQIVGCSVVTEEGKKVGVVKDLWLINNNDLLVVQKGKREILIPFHKEICRKVNLEKREIVIAPSKGLLESNEI